MTKRTARRAFLLVALGLICFANGGCNRPDRSLLDSIPSEDRARAALETALTAWQSGQPAGVIQGDGYKVEVLDHVWQSKRKLTSFAILQSEEKPGPRWFTVSLNLKNAPAQRVSYAVAGIDPLWVYREEDYNQACGVGGK